MKKYVVVRAHAHLVDDALSLLATELDKYLEEPSQLVGGISVNYIPSNGKFLVTQALTCEVDNETDS